MGNKRITKVEQGVKGTNLDEYIRHKLLLSKGQTPHTLLQ